MIELMLKNFIDNNLNYPAYMEIPNSPPDNFFVIEKVGGSRDEFIDSATVAIQTYAPSMYQTAKLSETMIDAVLNDFKSQPDVASVELNSSYNFPDTSTKRYRYQALFEIYYYGGNENE